MYGYRTVLVLALLGLTACRAVSKEDFDEALATALCARDVRCGMYENETSCKREVMHWVIPRAGLGQKYDESLSEGRTRYDANAAGACLEKIRSGSCIEPPLSRVIEVGIGYPGRELGFGVADACRFLMGTVADGGECQSMADCGPGSFCTNVYFGSSSAGVCRPRTGKGEAYSAHTFTSLCAPGLIPAQSTCEEPVIVGEGQGCQNLECAPGLYCSYEGRDGVCRRWRIEGEPCADVGGPFCAWSLSCHDGFCRRRGGEGADCVWKSFNDVGEPGCQLDFFCDYEPSGRGLCRKLLGEGASCRTDQSECAAELYCTMAESGGQRGICQRRVAPGGP